MATANPRAPLWLVWREVATARDVRALETQWRAVSDRPEWRADWDFLYAMHARSPLASKPTSNKSPSTNLRRPKVSLAPRPVSQRIAPGLAVRTMRPGTATNGSWKPRAHKGWGG